MAEASWEPEDTIPKFIRDFYEDKSHFGKNLPNPVVKNSKQVGGTKYHLLSWQKESEAENWVSEDVLKIYAQNEALDSAGKSCNTLKFRDKRDRRHTVGILVAVKPCGIIVLHEEL